MQTIYAPEPLPQHGRFLFLAGPTPRSTKVPSWRPEALRVLDSLGFDGIVLAPEDRSGIHRAEYLDQVEWEYAALHHAAAIAFWIPRKLPEMPGFTTNVEFGFYLGKRPVVLGSPPDAEKVRYLHWLYTRETGRAPESTLEDTLRSAIALM